MRLFFTKSDVEAKRGVIKSIGISIQFILLRISRSSFNKLNSL